MTIWFVIIGALLVLMALLGALVDRLPLSTGLIYLLIGFALGPSGVGLLVLDPISHAPALELVFEIVVLISLFSVGLKLKTPFAYSIWRLPLRLATVAMLLTIIGITVFAMLVLQLPFAAALLLGGVLAPTDPVLASDIQIRDADDRDRARFGLSAEGGMNDGTAFPFVMLALILMPLSAASGASVPTLDVWLHWLLIDGLWGVGASTLIGWLCALAIGHTTIALRRRFAISTGFEEFLTLGLIALSYGLALAVNALGFLAVFAAGVALRHVQTKYIANQRAMTPAPPADKRQEDSAPPSAATASTEMVEGVLGFNQQFERIAEVLAVLLLGGLLSNGLFDSRGLLLAAVLFIVIRPLAILSCAGGLSMSRHQLRLVTWFGIRGVGSLYYLMYAINHGVPTMLAESMTALVLTVIATSIVVHGISATPLMRRYARLENGKNYKRS